MNDDQLTTLSLVTDQPRRDLKNLVTDQPRPCQAAKGVV
jgi:hypothetical protein